MNLLWLITFFIPGMADGGTSILLPWIRPCLKCMGLFLWCFFFHRRVTTWLKTCLHPKSTHSDNDSAHNNNISISHYMKRIAKHRVTRMTISWNLHFSHLWNAFPWLWRKWLWFSTNNQLTSLPRNHAHLLPRSSSRSPPEVTQEARWTISRRHCGINLRGFDVIVVIQR